MSGLEFSNYFLRNYWIVCETSVSGLWERRLEMRRLCICLFSSWDLMSSSWIFRFLLGLLWWWTSLRACFSTFLSSSWNFTSPSLLPLLAAAIEATALILETKWWKCNVLCHNLFSSLDVTHSRNCIFKLSNEFHFLTWQTI